MKIWGTVRRPPAMRAIDARLAAFIVTSISSNATPCERNSFRAPVQKGQNMVV